jgi:hypothetical protein
VNEYYTKAQQDRAKRSRQGDTGGLGGLEDYRMAADDHWWTANAILSQVCPCIRIHGCLNTLTYARAPVTYLLDISKPTSLILGGACCRQTP